MASFRRTSATLSSRSERLKDSMNPFCWGSPGTAETLLRHLADEQVNEPS
jgi:hypothetical protein